jgi:hypothetical protein
MAQKRRLAIIASEMAGAMAICPEKTSMII